MSNQAIALAIQLALKTFAIQLLSAAIDYEWEKKDGKQTRTENVNGIRYNCFVEDLDMEKITIITAENAPIIDPKAITKVKEDGKKVFVTFSGLAINSYSKDRNYIVNASAEKAIVKNG